MFTLNNTVLNIYHKFIILTLCLLSAAATAEYERYATGTISDIFRNKGKLFIMGVVTMAEKTDRRVRYTKMVLKQSLLGLMGDRPIEKITVKDICEKADINRGTFYSHYADPYDLLTQIENELFDEILASVESTLKVESISGLLDKIFDSIMNNIELCRVLFSDHGDKVFVRRIMYIARDRSIAEWKKMIPSAKTEQLERLYTFFASGCVAIVQDWFQNGMKESPKELSDFIEKISANGLRALLI